MTSRLTVGYYVHHQGLGHLQRARNLGDRLRATGLEVVVLSSLPRPADLDESTLGWVELPRDDEDAATAVDATAHGRLHWVPRHHDGLRRRMSLLSRWLDEARPSLLISDVSQEVALLSRLHGVPVLSVVLPGDRGDRPHQLGLGVSDRLVGFWPATATSMVSGLPATAASRLVALGGLSRYAPAEAARAPAGRRRVVVMAGRGGDAWTPRELDDFGARLEGWSVTALGPGHWVDDPWQELCAADVVVTRAGQSSVAEVAASRTPAVVIPAPRPHLEQAHTAAQLASGSWPALVLEDLPGPQAPQVLAAAAQLDGEAWDSWCDGRAGDRFVEVVAAMVEGR
ncbi:hypothetical protein D9V37_12910 [Nocardioides mangrovicus]|uniref:Glycosyl transferase family 28 C-terminal domain-containing protein n=1 Tax=Nocardioides mangrovicus TaxID=2478913 RepID=A0A3L8P0V0_9ACTN|nr:glycosyltransferase [Nocardioides mangrovicus]RLV48641.1 hypothetical protein D9V37_12910 [Nocardioides mangrovicus]